MMCCYYQIMTCILWKDIYICSMCGMSIGMRKCILCHVISNNESKLCSCYHIIVYVQWNGIYSCFLYVYRYEEVYDEVYFLWNINLVLALSYYCIFFLTIYMLMFCKIVVLCSLQRRIDDNSEQHLLKMIHPMTTNKINTQV